MIHSSQDIDSRLHAHEWIPEPELQFHPDREEDRHVHPLEGLAQYGPYSRATIAEIHDPIRVAVITPHDLSKKAASLVKEFEEFAKPKERQNYLIDYPGMSRVFGVRAMLAPKGCHVAIEDSVDKELYTSDTPQTVLAHRLTKALSVIEARRSEFDVALVVLPTRWEPAFKGSDGDDFDLHDYLKAITAARGIPLQIVQEARALSYSCRCSVRWRLAIALYCKAGGVPWKLAQPSANTAFVGISFAVRNHSHGERFVTCCSQVFDADGVGLEFVAYQTPDARLIGRNPFLSRTDMRRVMARSLVLYQRRHAGQSPQRVVVHKSTHFTHEEIDGCFDAWSSVPDLELIQVQDSTPWRAVEIAAKKSPSNYPCERGTMLQLSGTETLLWTSGNLSKAFSGNYYKEAKGIPSPLGIKRYAGHGSYRDSCSEILGLSKMNWNNDGIYDRLPVTLGFSSTLARVMKRMDAPDSKPYQIRFLM